MNRQTIHIQPGLMLDITGLQRQGGKREIERESEKEIESLELFQKVVAFSRIVKLKAKVPISFTTSLEI